MLAAVASRGGGATPRAAAARCSRATTRARDARGPPRTGRREALLAAALAAAGGGADADAATWGDAGEDAAESKGGRRHRMLVLGASGLRRRERWRRLRIERAKDRDVPAHAAGAHWREASLVTALAATGVRAYPDAAKRALDRVRVHANARAGARGRKVLVLGASGRVAAAVSAELLERGNSVRGIVGRAPVAPALLSNPHFEAAEEEVTTMSVESMRALLSDCSGCVCCLGYRNLPLEGFEGIGMDGPPARLVSDAAALVCDAVAGMDASAGEPLRILLLSSAGNDNPRGGVSDAVAHVCDAAAGTDDGAAEPLHLVLLSSSGVDHPDGRLRRRTRSRRRIGRVRRARRVAANALLVEQPGAAARSRSADARSRSPPPPRA